MASWDIEAAGGKYTVKVAGKDETAKEFDGSVRVKEAVNVTASAAGLSSVIVNDEDGTELQPSDGGKTLAEVGNLLLYPKSSGSR